MVEKRDYKEGTVAPFRFATSEFTLSASAKSPNNTIVCWSGKFESDTYSKTIVKKVDSYSLIAEEETGSPFIKMEFLTNNSFMGLSNNNRLYVCEINEEGSKICRFLLEKEPHTYFQSFCLLSKKNILLLTKSYQMLIASFAPSRKKLARIQYINDDRFPSKNVNVTSVDVSLDRNSIEFEINKKKKQIVVLKKDLRSFF